MHMSVQLYNYSKRARSCRCTASGPSDAEGGGRGLPSAGWVSLAPPTDSCLTGGGVVIRTRLAVGVSGSESEVGAGGGDANRARFGGSAVSGEANLARLDGPAPEKGPGLGGTNLAFLAGLISSSSSAKRRARFGAAASTSITAGAGESSSILTGSASAGVADPDGEKGSSGRRSVSPSIATAPGAVTSARAAA